MELPTKDAQHELIRYYAVLQAQFGSEFGQRPLVLPNSKYFPDAFAPNASGVERLLQRLQHHTGLTDIPIAVGLDSAPVANQGSCSSGACGTAAAEPGQLKLEDDGNGWTVHLGTGLVTHPVALTCALSTALGAIFIEETRPEQWARPAGPLQEFAAVGLGLGPLLLEGSYIYSKSCGGPQVSQLTTLGTGQLALLTGLFAAGQGHSLKPAKRALGTTQAALVSHAIDWCKANQPLTAQLSSAPELVAAGTFEIADPKQSSFGWFRRSNSQEVELPVLGAANLPHKLEQKHRSPAKDDGLDALVAEALQEARLGQ